MTVETELDRTAMLADFGECITFYPLNAPVRTVKCIFDNIYQEVESGMSVGISMQQPRILCTSSDINGVAEGDSLIRGNTTYIIRVMMYDGIGMTELMLEKQ